MPRNSTISNGSYSSWINFTEECVAVQIADFPQLIRLVLKDLLKGKVCRTILIVTKINL